jgi:hypothetical protein
MDESFGWVEKYNACNIAVNRTATNALVWTVCTCAVPLTYNPECETVKELKDIRPVCETNAFEAMTK